MSDFDKLMVLIPKDNILVSQLKAEIKQHKLDIEHKEQLIREAEERLHIIDRLINQIIKEGKK